MRLSPDARYLYFLCRQPQALLRFGLDGFQVDGRITLPAEPVAFDIDRTGRFAGISYGPRRLLSIIDLTGKSPTTTLESTGELGQLRFQSDSSALIVANLGERMLAFYQMERQQLMVNLPLAVRPDHLCFKADGGELFVTGAGMDGVVVVAPYYTPYVTETVLAGHAPGVMAASLLRTSMPQYLFVANPGSGDVTILDITKRRVVAVTPVGTNPSNITITPDDQYALVLNEGSGDLAVIRIANVTRAATDFKRSRKGPIFMMVPVGSKPVSAAIVTI